MPLNRLCERYEITLHSLVLALIITSVISSSGISPTETGNGLAYLSYIIFIIAYAYIFTQFELPKGPGIVFLIIYFILIVNAFRIFLGYYHPSHILRSLMTPEFVFYYFANLSAYILASFSLVFLIPHVLSRRQFFIVLTYISTFSIIIGLPAYILGNYSIASVSIEVYTSLEPFRQFGISIPALASFWIDANAMSKVAMAGALGSFYLFIENNNRLTRLLLVINTVGLFLANSKSILVAFPLSLTIYLIYDRLGPRWTICYLLACGTTAVISFALILGGYGTENIVAYVGFPQRVELWRMSIDTVVKYPFGIGIYDIRYLVTSFDTAETMRTQNSYLRILVMTGFVGGIPYIGFLIWAVFKYVNVISSRTDAVTLAFFLAFLVIQVTDTAGPLGVNKSSLIFGGILGYIIKDMYGAYSA